MKFKILIIICFLLASNVIVLAQFGATVTQGGPSYTENETAMKALHNGDYATAKAIWEKYADKDLWAQNHLGYLYETQKDYNKALGYYLKSANKGNTHAMLNLARLYYKGQGVNQNYAEALRWLKIAASLDSAIAMYNLGYMYMKGQGTQKNIDEAKRWYKAAASKGDKKSQKALEILSKNQYWMIF